MPLVDLLDFYEELVIQSEEEAERMKQNGKR